MLRTIRGWLFAIGFAFLLAAVSGTNLAAQTPLSVDTTTTTPDATTGTTNGTMTGTTTGTATGAVTGTDTGVNASPTTTSSLTGTPQIQQIVEVTKSVPVAATPLAAFTVPAGSRLVITDVIVTNTGATATCTVAVGRTSQPSVTGPLCVPGHTTMSLALATGLEFAPGDAVQLTNAPDTTTTTATTTATSTTSTVSVHLRGFLLPAA
jgi:hypothetical protein